MAEHSFLVSILAIEISRRIGHSNSRGGPINIEKEHQIMRWAMWHDLPEVINGDQPTPTKATLKMVAGFDVSKRADHMVSREYAKIEAETFSTIKSIVKLADLLEARIFLQEEGKGEHSREVHSGVIKQIDEHLKKCKRDYQTFNWDAITALLM